ncbi:MAG: RNA polymerase sigma factor [Bacteroidales bacterium]|nr:RNA polymerase sigma factor [Bacteroidales bacterium]
MRKSRFIKEVVPFGENIYRIACKMVYNTDLAKDVVQDVFVKLWNRRDELEKCSNIGGFVYSVTKNTCIDRLRLTKKTVELSNISTFTEPDFGTPDATEHVKKLINRLPEQQREVINLRDVKGFDIEEIATVLNLSVSNVRATLSIARKKIRNELIALNNYGLQTNKNTDGEIL